MSMTCCACSSTGTSDSSSRYRRCSVSERTAAIVPVHLFGNPAPMEGLLELDARVKGVGGVTAGDGQIRLAFDLWITDRVASSG